MIYNVANTSDVGKPCRVFDANGLEWKQCLEIDTETGRIERFKTDAKGFPVVNETGDVLIRETIKTAAPLRIEFVSNEDATAEQNTSKFSAALRAARAKVIELK